LQHSTDGLQIFSTDHQAGKPAMWPEVLQQSLAFFKKHVPEYDAGPRWFAETATLDRNMQKPFFFLNVWQLAELRQNQTVYGKTLCGGRAAPNNS